MFAVPSLNLFAWAWPVWHVIGLLFLHERSHDARGLYCDMSRIHVRRVRRVSNFFLGRLGHLGRLGRLGPLGQARYVVMPPRAPATGAAQRTLL